MGVHWPLWELCVRTPRLELRPDDDESAQALMDLAVQGVHDPATMPFTIPWTDEPPGELERKGMQFLWGQRHVLSPEQWHVNFVIRCEGEIVGMQSIEAKDFALRRTVLTGSWLGRAHQGKGIGKEMRWAVLHFAFAGLGAIRAESAAWQDNARSHGVSRAVGYQENGDEWSLRRGAPDRMVRLVLDRQGWEANPPPFPVTIDGLEACLPLLGAAE